MHTCTCTGTCVSMYTTNHITCNKNAPQVNVTVSNIPVDMSYWGTAEQSCVPSAIIEQVMYKNMYDYYDRRCTVGEYNICL